MCRSYDAGECIEPGCTGRVTCHDFDRRCTDHDINGRYGRTLLEDDSESSQQMSGNDGGVS